MGDIFKPIEKKPWIYWSVWICYPAFLIGAFLHYKNLEYLSAFALIMVCAGIAKMQIKIMKEHIEKLSDRVRNLEAAVNNHSERHSSCRRVSSYRSKPNFPAAVCSLFRYWMVLGSSGITTSPIVFQNSATRWSIGLITRFAIFDSPLK